MAVDFQLHRQTHVAHLTVEEPILATDPAYATALAVVLVLVLVIEQVAHQARVLSAKRNNNGYYWRQTTDIQ